MFLPLPKCQCIYVWFLFPEKLLNLAVSVSGADLPGWHGVATATLKIALPPQLPPQLAALKTKKGCGSSDICESEFLIAVCKQMQH